MTEKMNINVRGVDRGIYHKGKVKALEQNKSMGQFISEALAEKLMVEKGKKQT